ncbi:hypothetical protein NSE01_24470 [Novosphingobium sediminis]|uniref:CHK kinase-like domain-containing protein n=1 Tax=Novosphingobium sediminis TaxID=707214 RepID=A0A512ALN1_9SPHN|nr:phosphotransferase [Novosphingobium sediminis]GEO00615.1 hypothetical protein NSE01_24470 [Novosphingobium sediminis]
MAHRSPRELIELYWDEVWNNRRAELIREICADPIVRHDPGSVTALSVEDQIARVRQQSEKLEPCFTHEVLLADDTYVTSVWNMHTRKGERIELCGIEVFKAVDGKFTDCWNSSYTPGFWGREGDASVPADLPPPPLIAGADQITPQWIQAVLQQAGLEAPRVSLLNTKPIGHGNLSATLRTEITYNANAADAVRSVVAKLTSGIGQAVEIAAAHDVYRRECEVYGFLGETPPLATPRCYWRNVGPDGRTINLVLEDLSERTRPGNQIAGCSVAEAEAVARELAALHAAFWDDARLDVAEWLYNRAADAETAAVTNMLAAKAFRERFTGRADPAMLDAIDAVVADLPRHFAAIPRGRTLVHGEPRVDNVLFEDGAEGPRAWLIDWQFADCGSPMFDLAYFLSGSLTVEDRRSIDGTLVERHHAAIAAKDPSYTLDHARAEFAGSLPLALYFSVGAILAMPPSEHGDLLLLTLAERNVAALRDWGVV